MLLPLKSEHIDCNEFDLQVVHVIPATPVSAHGPSLTTTHASVIDLVLSIEKSFSAFDASRLTNSAAFRAAARDGRWAIWNAMRAEFGHNHRPIHISVGIFSPQQSSPLAARTLAWTRIARALAQPRIARTLAWQVPC